MVFHCYILIYCKLLIYFQTKYYLFLLFSITDASLYIQTQYSALYLIIKHLPPPRGLHSSHNP